MWDFQALKAQAHQEAQLLSDQATLEAFRIKYLGRKGILAEIYASLGQASLAEKPTIGKGANELKIFVTEEMAGVKKRLEAGCFIKTNAGFDVSLPGVSFSPGHRHLLQRTMTDISEIFRGFGFSIVEGPEIETEFHNFSALNIPVDHPSRDAFDTFYVDLEDPDQKGRYQLLRSHTSPGQIRIMKEHQPPLAVVIPGKVYRPDAVDASHSFMFHQIEGLFVDQQVSFAELKGLLMEFCKKFFQPNIKLRFRPHFFPFTEPSAEVDISCFFCQGKGCPTCGRKGWLEILGCGMVHPKVFAAVGYPSGRDTGFAFGMGVERIAMLKYGIQDIRVFFENDMRFLNQF